ncbi:hypothetical protein BBJ28_00025702, partial [Nothophytophthora sp. Chile5]
WGDCRDAFTMGKKRFLADPFPPMELSAGDKTQLQALVRTFVDENLPLYENFLTVEGRRVNDSRWKLFKVKETIRLHVEREIRATDGDHRAIMSEASETAGMPVVLCEGTMLGKLDDVMFGAANSTVEAARLKASYVDDLSGAAVLGVVVEPTVEEPLDSTVLKWMEVELPLHATSLVKNRDYVYIEATGFVRLANGERVGYQVMHSIGFPQAHELPDRIRGDIHVCAFFRQEREQSVEVHVTAVCVQGGNMQSLLLYPSALKLLTCTKYAHCGEMKKLAWLMHKRHTEARRSEASSREDSCVGCAVAVPPRRFGSFGKPWDMCKLCFGPVCRRCCVKKRLNFVAPDLEIEERKVTFCPGCSKEALELSTLEAARSQLLGQSAQSVYCTDAEYAVTSPFDSS